MHRAEGVQWVRQGPQSCRIMKLTGSFALYSVVVTEAVFWIPFMRPVGDFAHKCVCVCVGGGSDRCLHRRNADGFERRFERVRKIAKIDY
jgi:hypothetical protein